MHIFRDASFGAQFGNGFRFTAALLVAFALLRLGVTQEAPMGGIKGQLTMSENGQPLADATVRIEATAADDETEEPYTRRIKTRKDGTFRLSAFPTGQYWVKPLTRNHNADRQLVIVSEGKTSETTFEADPSQSYLELYSSQHVFTPDEQAKVELHGFVQAKNVKVDVYKLDIAQLAKNGGLRQTLSPDADPDALGDERLRKAKREFKDLSHQITKRDAEGAFVESLPLGSLPEGYYLITCSADNVKARVALCVSQLALVTKSHGDDSLCFATDIQSGVPTAGVQIYAEGKGGLKKVGETDRNGLADVKAPEFRDRSHVVVGMIGSSVALVGIQEWRDNGDKVRIVGYCERPAYRPGDPIQFKGIVRRTSSKGYELPGTGMASVVVSDPDGMEIEHFKVPISVHGTFSGSFTTSPESKPGGYTIKCTAFGAESHDIWANVVAYRKPEFSIEVTPDRPNYVLGSRASATIECRYYYGGPVVGATVKALISRSPYFEMSDDDRHWHHGYVSYGEGGEFSQETTLVTDAEGKAHVSFDTVVPGDPKEFDTDMSYNISVTVSEDAAKSFSGEGTVTVFRGDYSLDTKVENPIVSPGESVHLSLKTRDVVDSHKPVPNREVTVEVGSYKYDEKPGDVGDSSTSEFKVAHLYKAVTGADGTVNIDLPVEKPEDFDIRIRSVDDHGHTITETTSAYVEGLDPDADQFHGNLTLEMDHNKYVVGSEARALIQTDVPGGSALICAQAEGVVWKKVVQIKAKSTIVTLPVTAGEAPNAYISIAYVRNKHFLRDDAELRVEGTERDLRITVKPAQDNYLPGQKAKVTLQTTDASGKPVAADVSVGAVDQGVYDIAPDDTDLKEALYPHRSDEVLTDYSFPEIYLDGGDKGSSKVPLRSRFRDTAFWVPSVWTGPTGTATIEMPLPDNLTGWRLTAVGISDTSLVGMSTSTFHTRKPLMARLELPQFLVEGDSQRMTVIITNDTGQDQDIKVKVEGTGLTLDSNKTRTVRVAKGTPQVLEYQVVAGKAGKASVTARAWVVNGPNDGVIQSFPIRPHGRIVTQHAAGEGSTEISLPLDAATDRTYGSLEISLSPTLAGGLVSSLNGMIDFPYGCVEQTMSRFMPAVLVAKAVKDLGLPAPANLKQLPKIVQDSLTRLNRMQHTDGGWGWWEYDESTPEMTALVLDGLARAKAAGWNVDRAQAFKAIDWAFKYLKDQEKTRNRKKGGKIQLSTADRLYLIYALLQWDHKKAARFVENMNLSRLTATELAWAALNYHAVGKQVLATQAINLLKGKAQEDEQYAYWPTERFCWGDEPTAIALNAFEAVRPQDTIVDSAVRYLVKDRRGEGWHSTRDSAYALIGLTQHLKRSKESGDSTAEVWIDGKLVRTVALNSHLSSDPNWTIQIPRSELRKSGALVKIVKQGAGSCYYTMRLESLDISPELKPFSTDRGLKVTRTYHRLEARPLENGTTRLLPSIKPVNSFASGDLIRVELEVRSDVPRQFVMIEEPIPSSCRMAERDSPGDNEEWNWWWSRTVILDDRISFFATDLPKGLSKISYTMRAEQPSRVRVLPTKVQNMYDPERTAFAAESGLQVSK